MTRHKKFVYSLLGSAIILFVMIGDLPAQDEESSNWIQGFRKKIGPVEIIPYFSFGIESHGNVYLATEETPEELRHPDGRSVKNPLRDRAGIVFHLDPGVRIFVRPQSLQRKNIYIGVNAIPSIKIFPGAEDINPFEPGDDKPDLIYLNHHITGQIRYTFGKRNITLAAGGAFDQPDIAARESHFRDITYWASARARLPKQFDLLVTYKGEDFNDDATGSTSFGSFIDNDFDAEVSYRLSPLLKVGGFYKLSKRNFYGIRFDPTEPIFDDDGTQIRPYPQDIDNDGTPESVKNFEQNTFGGRARAQIRPHIHVSGMVGYTKREVAERQFGAPEYDSIIGRGSVSTTITGVYWTRVQAFAEYTLTDTFRAMSDYEKNSFTDPELGAFTVLPDDFSVAVSRRFVVDVVQRVNARRGDQVLFGIGYQKDTLKDVLNSTLNLYGSGLTTEQRLERSEAAFGQLYSENVAPFITEREQNMFIVSGGYRFNLMRWLGIQARAIYYKGDFDASTTLDPNVPAGVAPNPDPADSGETDYFAVSAGFVVNLNVF